MWVFRFVQLAKGSFITPHPRNEGFLTSPLGKGRSPHTRERHKSQRGLDEHSNSCKLSLWGPNSLGLTCRCSIKLIARPSQPTKTDRIQTSPIITSERVIPKRNSQFFQLPSNMAAQVQTMPVPTPVQSPTMHSLQAELRPHRSRTNTFERPGSVRVRHPANQLCALNLGEKKKSQRTNKRAF